MATATSPTTPQFVQQAFNWDEIETAPVLTKGQAVETVERAPRQRSVKSAPPMAQSYSVSSSARRGRCEHVGGILASVLERYGIGIDELIAEIDGNVK